MADTHFKSQDIPFVIDGVVKIVKSVTKHTTCNDVIDKLPNLQCPLAVFESVNGVEKQLPGKTKLLKVWRAHGLSSKVVFVVKRSEDSDLKRRTSGLFSFKHSMKSQTRRKISGEHLKKVSDLAFYVRYQKSKVKTMKRKFDEIDNANSEPGQTVMKHFSSSSSVDSMDAFLAKTDLDKMARFLSFCGGVTEEQLGVRKTPKTSRDKEICVAERKVKKEVKEINRNIIYTGLKNAKLGFKEKFTTKSKLNKQTTSTVTISSADTGYQSVNSTGQYTHGVPVKRGSSALPKRHTFIDIDQDGLPRHSTPMIGRYSRKPDQVIDSSFSLSAFDESEGKDVILQKFMADQQAMTKSVECRASVDSVGCYGVLPDTDSCYRATNRCSLPAFNSQKDLCRFYWDVNCDSDSDSSSLADESDLWNSSQLDNAFIDSFGELSDGDFLTPRNKTLRRESAVTNLARFSLQTKSINIDNDDDSFDYSFDCTFPRMDESQSVDFTTGFDDNSFNFSGGKRSTSSDGESVENITSELLKDVCDSEDSFADSDEGLGSMSSGSVQEMLYI